MAKPEPLELLDAIDPASAFGALANFGGDYAQAAGVLRCAESELRELAAKHGWDAKLRNMGIADTGVTNADKSAASQRALDRGINFVQAARLRSMLDGILIKLASDPKEFEAFTTEASVQGHKRTLKNVEALANAIATAQGLASRALQDDGDNRAADRKALGGKSVGLSVTEALNRLDNLPGVSSADLVRKSLELEDPKKAP